MTAGWTITMTAACLLLKYGQLKTEIVRQCNAALWWCSPVRMCLCWQRRRMNSASVGSLTREGDAGRVRCVRSSTSLTQVHFQHFQAASFLQS